VTINSILEFSLQRATPNKSLSERHDGDNRDYNNNKMSMNWADSSDDEDETFFAPENNPPVPNEEPNQDDDEDYEDHEADEPPGSGRARKDFILPEHPPYTAFIGNLAFSVKDPQELADKM
jgi:hypothetical protein